MIANTTKVIEIKHNEVVVVVVFLVNEWMNEY